MVIQRARLWDVGPAALGVAGLIVEGCLRAKSGLAPGAYVLALAAATPLAWRRSRAPLLALAGVELGALACVFAFNAGWAATGMVIVGLYTVALLGDRQRSLVVGGLTAVAVIGAILLVDGALDLGSAAIRVTLVFVALASGDVVRLRRALRAAARERAQREAHEREEEARRRAAEERLRIARELHDTLAHSLVAINVRASVAVDLDEESQDRSAALRDIKQVSATALRDLRATLSLLRERGDAAPTAPAADLGALSGLVDRVRAAGLHAEVELEVNGGVPSAIGGAAFRIIQEALTNILRHANASRAHVGVRASGDALDIEVTDDGRAHSAGASPGLGVRGMVERAAVLGGRVEVGPGQEGGWRVHAVLPLGGAKRT